MIKKQFQIQGMHCVGCAMTIDGAIEELAGVQSSATHYAHQITTVRYDDTRVDEADILEAIQKAGYQGKMI
jgi:Cu2+-exporting ATPase